MPYNIKKAGNKYCVVKKSDGKQIACHPSPEKAKAQVRALYANEGFEGKELDGLMSAFEGIGDEEIKAVVQEHLGAVEAVWSDNAEGLPQADVVIIRPGESANRRYYPREAIEEAVRTGFWDDTPMFLNHGDRAMPRKRNLEHLKGRIEAGSTYVGSEGEARGKVTFIDPAFATFIKNAGKSAGLSAVHEFMGQRFKGNDNHYHERVNKFVVNHSVDFVAFAAAGGEVAAFLPASESEDDVDYSKLSKKMLEEHREELDPEVAALLAAESDDPEPDPVPDPAPEPEPTPDPPAPEGFVTLAQARKIAQEAAENVAHSYQERDRKMADAKTAVEAHVAKSGLPDKSKARLIGQFSAAESYDKDAVQLAIEGEATYLKEAAGWHGPRVRGLGDSETEEGDDTGLSADDRAKLYPTMTAVEQQMAFVPRTGRKSAEEAGKAAN